MMPRLFDERVGYFSVRQMDYGRDEHRAPQRRYITRWRLEKKDPNAALSEPVKPIVYYIDPATPDQVGAVPEEGHRDWQPAFEAAGFKNAHHRQGRADARAGSRLEPGGRALLGDPLAAVDDRERLGPARQRSAHRRDPRGGHPVLSQRHEPGARLVLRAGRPARSARADAAAARRPDGPPARVRRRARGRPHARLPAQHEGQLDVSAGEGARPRVGQDDGPHADADGLLALQLRRAARGQDRRRRSRPGHRAVRQVGDDVGLQADPRRAALPTTRRRRSTSGRAQQDETPWLRFSTDRIGAAPIPAS